MEVQKHPHHVMHSKKWHEYLLEFFMLFLAVFLGFIADNVRESIADKHKEKEYIRSMIKDLKTDTSKIAANDKLYTQTLKGLDSLINNFDLIDSGFNEKFYKLFRWITYGYPDFIYTDGTIQQLKNAGGFRLIENSDVIDSIMAYDAAVKRALINEELLKENYNAALQNMEDLISLRTIKKILSNAQQEGKELDQLATAKIDFLITHDKTTEGKFFNKLVAYRTIMQSVKNVNYKPLKDKGASLIAFLKKEYHLKNE